MKRNATRARQTATNNETLRAVKSLASAHVYRIAVRAMKIGGEAAVLRLMPAYGLPNTAEALIAKASK